MGAVFVRTRRVVVDIVEFTPMEVYTYYTSWYYRLTKLLIFSNYQFDCVVGQVVTTAVKNATAMMIWVFSVYFNGKTEFEYTF